jgi:hypothetical protein
LRLVRTARGWSLAGRFSLAAFVNPCWDEAWYANAYPAGLWRTVRVHLEKQCPRLGHPLVRARRAAYARRGCHSRSYVFLEALIAAGQAPDWRPQTVEAVCAAAPGERGVSDPRR